MPENFSSDLDAGVDEMAGAASIEVEDIELDCTIPKTAEDNKDLGCSGSNIVMGNRTCLDTFGFRESATQMPALSCQTATDCGGQSTDRFCDTGSGECRPGVRGWCVDTGIPLEGTLRRPTGRCSECDPDPNGIGPKCAALYPQNNYTCQQMKNCSWTCQ